MRKSLLERIKEKECDIREDTILLINLLYGENVNARLFFKESFTGTKYSPYYANFDEAFCRIISCDKAKNSKELNRIIASGYQPNLECFLDCLELLKTMCDLGRHSDFHDDSVEHIKSVVEDRCERLGYGFAEKDGVFAVVLKNPVAEAVAAQTKETTQKWIYAYLATRKGDVEQKRSIIKTLADDVELICKTYNNDSDYAKLKQFIQCVRHTKEKQIQAFPFYYTDEELWLDNTFDMIVGALAFARTKDIVKEIKNLENAHNCK